jgi:ClpP class serine protease
VQAWLDRVYGDFTEKVARGRELSAADVERAAGGRIWSGSRARELGLVDALGGCTRALALTREAAGLAPDAAIELVEYPREIGWLERHWAEPPDSRESPPITTVGQPQRSSLEGAFIARLRQVLQAENLPCPAGVLSIPPVRVGP